MKAPAFVFGVDLDGVVADFIGALRPIAAEWLGVSLRKLPKRISFGLPEWHLDTAGGYEALHRFAVTQRGIFRNIKPIPGAPAVLRRLSADGVRIRVITHRLFIKYFHQEAITQTVEWLDQYGIPYWDLCFMRDKAAVGADLYIEDTPDNILRLRQDGHKTIVFSNTTNVSLAGPRANSWQHVEKLVRAELRSWNAKHTSKAKVLPGE